MAAPAIAVERYRVEYGEGFTMPVVSLTDRRAADNRIIRFVFHSATSRPCCMAAQRGAPARFGRL